MANWTDDSFEGEKNVKNKNWREDWILNLMFSWEEESLNERMKLWEK